MAYYGLYVLSWIGAVANIRYITAYLVAVIQVGLVASKGGLRNVFPGHALVGPDLPQPIILCAFLKGWVDMKQASLLDKVWHACRACHVDMQIRCTA